MNLDYAAPSVAELPEGGIRVVVPFTPAARALRRRVMTLAWGSIIVWTVGFLAATIVAWPALPAWVCFGPIVVFLIGVVHWAARNPDSVARFREGDVTIDVTDDTLTVSFASANPSIGIPTSQIRRIRVERCDFSRCWRIVLVCRRDSGPHRWTVAVHEDSSQLMSAATALRVAAGLPEGEAPT